METLVLPQSYDEWLTTFRPRAIADESEAERVRAELDRLMDLPEHTPEDWEKLALLGSLLHVWEADRYPFPAVSPAEMIEALLEARDLPQRALVGEVFATPSIASEVINGHRKLTYEHVGRLAHFFHVSPAAFFPESPVVEPAGQAGD